jgi:Fe(3+) dicitrate transport protein
MMMKNIRIFLFLSWLTLSGSLAGQTLLDSTRIHNLDSVELVERAFQAGVAHYGSVKDQVIFASKKNEIIRLDQIQADLSSNNMRQIYAKVPGLTIWESDASGIQTNLATRGLSPNRNWEFNVRQNGADICSEVFGYPEAYYTPPVEAVEQLEFIRGAASLQFGPQFGGMLNYRLKFAKPGVPFHFESFQTLGSYGLFNSFNAVGGNSGKFSWYGYFHRRKAETWRQNNDYDVHTAYGAVQYQITQKLSARFDYTRMNYESQQPGGLTDQQFQQDPRSSARSRNWMSTPWNTGSLDFTYRINDHSSIVWKSFFTHSDRKSVGFVRPINVRDTIQAGILAYHNRQVDQDQYRNLGSEIRWMWSYTLSGRSQHLATGVRAYKGMTHRDQLGLGTAGTDPDFQAEPGSFGRSLEFSTWNYAWFAEHLFQWGKRLKMVPGVRLEKIDNSRKGRISASGILQPETRNRLVLLAGMGVEFATSHQTSLYGNVSQSFRPVTFSELTPSALTEVIDPNLKDSRGYNIDLGWRGRWDDFLVFDLSFYHLQYEGRIGAYLKDSVLFRTNIGNSSSTGIESFIEVDFTRMLWKQVSGMPSIKVFASNAWNRSRYTSWDNPAIANDPAKSIKGKRVENAPEYIHRFGLSLENSRFSIGFQTNFVGGIYADAANTLAPNAAATVGYIEAYQVMDLTGSFRIAKSYLLKGGINNLGNSLYATRRAGGYPGPGLLPGQGRTWYLGIGIQI